MVTFSKMSKPIKIVVTVETAQAAGALENFVRQAPHLKYVETYDLPLDAAGRPRPELFVADKLHFNADGYKRLRERLRPALSEIK